MPFEGSARIHALVVKEVVERGGWKRARNGAGSGVSSLGRVNLGVVRGFCRPCYGKVLVVSGALQWTAFDVTAERRSRYRIVLS